MSDFITPETDREQKRREHARNDDIYGWIAVVIILMIIAKVIT